MAGDGQVSLGNTVIKGNARKVRRIGAGGAVLAGFAGATADAGPEQAAGGATSGKKAEKKADVVDADFEVVDEDKGKK